MSDITEHVGELIREARIKAGLTQKELGGKMGITESAVNKLENQKTPPSVATLNRVAGALGLKLRIHFE